MIHPCPGETGPTPATVDIAVPVNDLRRAKTRLPLPPQVREHLVIGFLIDTLHAALDCAVVRTVTVVTDDSAAARAARRTGADTFAPQLPRPGLNRDLSAFARSSPDDHPLAVLLADLPALTPPELAAALTECGFYSAAFASDEEGCGTTLLYSCRRSQLRPAFGDQSARRHHRSGAQPLTQVGPGLRRDVDTLADLTAAQTLGVGMSTRAEIDEHIDLLFPDRHENDERRAPACKM